jgi:hypothetical protein
MGVRKNVTTITSHHELPISCQETKSRKQFLKTLAIASAGLAAEMIFLALERNNVLLEKRPVDEGRTW